MHAIWHITLKTMVTNQRGGWIICGKGVVTLLKQDPLSNLHSDQKP